MANRVLITGGAGFIGLRIARALIAAGAEVTLVDNFFRGANDAELRAVLEEARLIEYDLTQPLDDAQFGGDYDQVYHLAAVVGVRHSNEAPLHVLRTNLLTTINVLDWCARRPPGVICFSSTSEVADGSIRLGLAQIPAPETIPLTIAEPRLPRSVYATSKMTGELLCLNYARVHSLPMRIVRYHNVYGPRMGYDHVIPQFIERVLEGQNPFKIYGAFQTRAFCYVDDAVDATLRLTGLGETEPLIVNIGNDQEELPIIDLAHKLFAVAGVNPEIEIHPPPPGSPERRCPNITQLRELTGYTPAVDLDDGLSKTLAWYRADWERRSRPLAAREG